MKDKGKRQNVAIESLRKFVKHDDARRLTKRDVRAWRDDCMKTLSAQTVGGVYLSTVRSLLNWAVENDKLPENVAAGVKQATPRLYRIFQWPGIGGSGPFEVLDDVCLCALRAVLMWPSRKEQ